MAGTDLISREEAIKAVNDVTADYVPLLIGRTEEIPLRVASAIYKLPSAERVGHWTKRTTVTSNGNTYYSYECSECGDHHGTMWKYCPHCGAHMEGAEE